MTPRPSADFGQVLMELEQLGHAVLAGMQGQGLQAQLGLVGTSQMVFARTRLLIAGSAQTEAATSMGWSSMGSSCQWPCRQALEEAAQLLPPPAAPASILDGFVG